MNSLSLIFLNCGMGVNKKTAEHKYGYKEKIYYFYSSLCKQTFDKDPATYVLQR